MISFDEALAIVCREAKPLGVETVPVSETRGRILAEPVTAAVDSPPADVSAMDGYALRAAELAAGRTSFRLAGESFPGSPHSGDVPDGACVRIFTGGPVPFGLDQVVIQEDVRRDGDVALVEGKIGKSMHVRKRGSDFAVGDVLLEAGRLLEKRALVAAAGADQATLSVWRRPRLAVMGTGDELAEPGEARNSGGRLIPESLSPGVAALAADWGGEAVFHRRLRDDLALMQAAAAQAVAETDLVVLTGGASVGERDFAKAAFDRLGLELYFSKVAIKPGKPVWFGRAQGTLIMGLPGNPTSAMVTARLLLAPLVAGLAGRDAMTVVRWREAVLAGGLAPVGDRETFERGHWIGNRIEPASNQDSGSQKTLADSDVLIRRPARADGVQPGATVDIISF